MPSINIHIFRGENQIFLHETLASWKEKFVEKYTEMNIADIRKEDLEDTTLSDCISPGFMGNKRMIIFRDLIIKTEKEAAVLESEKNIGNGHKELYFDDIQWIQMLQQAPEGNFFLFLGNKKPVTDLEKWLIEHATIHDFPLPSSQEIVNIITRGTGISHQQALRVKERLNNNFDFIYQEIKKIQLVDKKSWTDEELKSVLPNYFEENNFEILTPLWKRNIHQLIGVFRDTLRTADPELTMAMITTMIRKVLIALVLLENPLIQHLSDIKPSQISTARNIQGQKKKLKELYDTIVTIDIKEKQGELNNKLDAFLMALLTYCDTSDNL